MTDKPEKATWLKDDEREWLVNEMNAEHAAKASTASHSIWRGLADMRVLALSLIYFGTSAGLYTLGIWAPQIIKEFGLSTFQVGFLNAVPPTVAVVAMVLWARHSDKTNERTWHVVVACIAAAAGLALAGSAGSWVSVVAALTLVNIGISSAKPPLWAMPTMFLSGSAAAAGIATINSIGNLGGFARARDHRLDQGCDRQLPGRTLLCVRLARPFGCLSRWFFRARSARCQRRLNLTSITKRTFQVTASSSHTRSTKCVLTGLPPWAETESDPRLLRLVSRLLRPAPSATVNSSLDFQDFDWGSDYYKKHGVMMPADGADQLRKFDAILFGSVGAPDIPDHITLWGLRLAICQPLDQYANVRPTRILPGITSPLRHVSGPELDWVIVRENSEGEYSGVGGRVHRGLPEEVATDVSIMTRTGVARIIRFAFKLAQSRPRKLLTVVTKSNAQRHAMVMWDEIAAEVAKEFPDVTWDKMLVDAMTMRMTMKPQTLDTIVATNLHADILSDLAAALAGSLGIAPTANLNPERNAPSMFEPIHGSAFDITGKGIANPVGTFWTAAMMLEHLGEKLGCQAINEGSGARDCRSVAAHARPRRQGNDEASHRSGLRGVAEGQRLASFGRPDSRAGIPSSFDATTTPAVCGVAGKDRCLVSHDNCSRRCSMRPLAPRRPSFAFPRFFPRLLRGAPSLSARERRRLRWQRQSRIFGPAR